MEIRLPLTLPKDLAGVLEQAGAVVQEMQPLQRQEEGTAANARQSPGFIGTVVPLGAGAPRPRRDW